MSRPGGSLPSKSSLTAAMSDDTPPVWYVDLKSGCKYNQKWSERVCNRCFAKCQRPPLSR